MISVTPIYMLVGLVLAYTALRTFLNQAHPRRLTSALFWSLLAVAFLSGDRLPAHWMGGLALALALLAGLGGVQKPTEGAPEEGDQGARLFLPALAIPLLTLALLLLFKRLPTLVQPDRATLVALGVACLVALLLALALTRRSPRLALTEGSRLLETIGWAAILPLYLAALGALFAKAGVGVAVADLLTKVLPLGNRMVAVSTYALGMALFTIILGNAFAAFPVMTAAIGLPVLVKLHGAHPAPMVAIGMLSGYCGTLLTPMAANYNLVPAALLELDDPYAVIRAQAPTALLLLAANLVLMNVLLFL